MFSADFQSLKATRANAFSTKMLGQAAGVGGLGVQRPLTSHQGGLGQQLCSQD
jgi:hypothetical protein